MIRITVEIVPFGIESEARVIGTAKIWNDGTGTKEIGNYKYIIRGNKRIKSGKVKNFPRKSKGVWSLIKEVLK